MPYAQPSNIVFSHYDPADERRRETLLALGNGLLLVRAAAPWSRADGTHYPGTYRAGLYNSLTEIVEGEEISNESVPNLPNWLALDFRLPGAEAWFSMDQAEILDYRHMLDTLRGTASRELRVRDAAGRITRLRERRLVSMAEPNLAALRLEILPENWSGRLEIRSGIDGAVTNANVPADRHHDGRHLMEQAGEIVQPGLLLLRAVTRQSRIALAVATRTRLLEPEALEDARCATRLGASSVAEELACDVGPDRAVALEKTAAVYCGLDGGAEPGAAALAALRDAAGFAQLEEDHARAWRPLHEAQGLEAERQPLGCSLGFHAFHLSQTASPHVIGRDLGFPPRGWQEAYRGQIFWEDTLVQPFLDLRYPEIARAHLMYRWRRLDDARAAARAARLRGAMFPWRSGADGFEKTPRFQFNDVSGGWMRDETHRQRHIGAAIAQAVWRYVLSTGDDAFLAEQGGELMLEVARFWGSLARQDTATGRYHIRGVVGPDEYHTRYPGADTPGIDDNTYTNVMAARVLSLAPRVLERLPAPARAALRQRIGLEEAELEHWDRVSRRLYVPFHADGVIGQFEGFETLRPLDIQAFRAEHPEGRVDQVLAARGDGVENYAISKQADLLMLLHLLPHGELEGMLAHMGYKVTEAQLRRSAAWHLAHCQHDSSLSPVACAGALARLDPERSWEFFVQTLRPDLESGKDSAAAEGAHLSAMGGAIDVLQRHYLGFRMLPEGMGLDPALPAELGPVRLTLRCRYGRFTLDWNGETLRMRADAANPRPAPVLLGGEAHALMPGHVLEIAPSAEAA